MVKPQKPPSGRTNLASCIVAAIFLIFLVIIVFIVYFTVFKPKDPKISVNTVQLPSFSVANNSVSFTFSQYVSVKNPNRAVFSHYYSTIQLLYSGSQVGFMFVPAGNIGSGRTQYMAATFNIQSFPLVVTNEASAATMPVTTTTTTTGPTGLTGVFGGNDNNNGYRVGPTMEIESRMEMAGRIRVLNIFNHHVDAKSECRVTIANFGGSTAAALQSLGSSTAEMIGPNSGETAIMGDQSLGSSTAEIIGPNSGETAIMGDQSLGSSTAEMIGPNSGETAIMGDQSLGSSIAEIIGPNSGETAIMGDQSLGSSTAEMIGPNCVGSKVCY